MFSVNMNLRTRNRTRNFKTLHWKFVFNLFINIQTNDAANFHPMAVPYNFNKYLYQLVLWVNISVSYTARKVSKYGVISGPYFPAFGLNTERYSVFDHFSRSDTLLQVLFQMEIQKIGYFFPRCYAAGYDRSLTDILHALENFR